MSEVGAKESKERNRKILRILRNIGIGLLGAAIVTVLVVTVFPLIFNITLIPGEPRSVALLMVLLTVVYTAITMIVSFFHSTMTKKIVTLVIGSLVGTIVMVIAVYIATTFLFLNSMQMGEFDSRTYDVVVMKESEYERITDLKNREIGVKDTDEDLGAYDALIQSTGLSFQLVTVDGGVGDLADNLLDGKVEAISVEEGGLALLYEELENFENDTRVIYTYKTQNQAYEPHAETLSTEPFVVYVSGIDQYGKTASVVGRSDVNQLVVVNPNTHKILLVNTPRDYYVQLSGTTGLKDKLTHAGIYGIETSIKTLEELYDVNIDYYVRVNFDSLINVVDQIGGIDVVSDKAFTPHTNSDVYVNEGPNHFDGKEALAYARERYAYETGDRHRGENQQQVISAIIEKVTGSRALVANYNNILNTLSGTFQTNMPNDMIVSLLRDGLANKGGWKIETISVDGTGSTQPTYSMGAGLPLYVMIPNEETVAQAKIKIADVMEGR